MRGQMQKARYQGYRKRALQMLAEVARQAA